MPGEKCSKCSAPMVAGYIPDAMYGGYLMSCWYEGEPEKRVFLGLKIAGKKAFELKAFRCSGCGFVDLYAP